MLNTTSSRVKLYSQWSKWKYLFNRRSFEFSSPLLIAKSQGSASWPRIQRRNLSSLTQLEKKQRIQSFQRELEDRNHLNYKISIIGRPNVGKSTLFNRLTGDKSIVHSTPGVTRDSNESLKGELIDLQFKLVDTAGLEEIQTFLPQPTPIKQKQHLSPTQLVNKQPLNLDLQSSILHKTEFALKSSDLILFLIDARSGITADDLYFANWLRKRSFNEETNNSIPIVLVANKVEDEFDSNFDLIQNNLELINKYPSLVESYSLGFGEPILLSGEHNLGLGNLYLKIKHYFKLLEPKKIEEMNRNKMNKEEKQEKEEEENSNVNYINLAIVGKPNVGKSTLVNAVLGEDRVLTGPQPGITRDAIKIQLHNYWNESKKPQNKYKITLIDTAGLKGTNISGGHGKYSEVDALAMGKSLNSIQSAQLVALLIDINPYLMSKTMNLDRKYNKIEFLQLSEQRVSKVLTAHDEQIAKKILDEGKALILIVNKWDLIKSNERKTILLGLNELMKSKLNATKGVTILPLSALNLKDLDILKQKVINTYNRWDTRINTGKLNNWLQALVKYKPHPNINGKAIKIKYITQINSRPPTFAVFSSRAKFIQEEYLRFIVNALREEFNLNGIPIRISAKSTENPFKPEEIKVNEKKTTETGKKSNKVNLGRGIDLAEEQNLQFEQEFLVEEIKEEEEEIKEENRRKAEVKGKEEKENREVNKSSNEEIVNNEAFEFTMEEKQEEEGLADEDEDEDVLSVDTSAEVFSSRFTPPNTPVKLKIQTIKVQPFSPINSNRTSTKKQTSTPTPSNPINKSSSNLSKRSNSLSWSVRRSFQQLKQSSRKSSAELRGFQNVLAYKSLKEQEKQSKLKNKRVNIAKQRAESAGRRKKKMKEEKQKEKEKQQKHYQNQY